MARLDVANTLKTRAYLVPFVVFMVFLAIGQIASDAIQWEHPSASWWKRAPEQWLYPLQSIVCFALVVIWRKQIDWQWHMVDALWGVLFGLIGIACWLTPCMVADRLTPDITTYFDESVWPWYKYLAGIDVRENGFNAGLVFAEDSWQWMTAVILRFFRAVIVVAIIEELFWRGYLMRVCVNPDHPWEVAFGTGSWLAYCVTTLCFMLVHQPVDYCVAFIYGTLAYMLTVWRKNLCAVIVMHAVANLILGWAALAWDKPGLW